MLMEPPANSVAQPTTNICLRQTILELLSTHNPINKVHNISQYLRTNIWICEKPCSSSAGGIGLELFRFGRLFVGPLSTTCHSKRIRIGSEK